MADTGEGFDLSVEGTGTIQPIENHEQPPKREPEQQHRRPLQAEAADHFEELAHAAERANEVLEKRGSPHRFCVYMNDEEIYIDVVLLNEDDEIDSIRTRKVTHADFVKLIDDMDRGSGLLIDKSA
jgi:hypothetical protein